MRAKEFLKEEYTPKDIEDFFTNCSEYFSYNKNPLVNMLYRGDYGNIRKDNFWMNQRNVLQGRKPVDTDEFVHTILNDLFSTAFNFPFRSGMMCSGSPGEASQYGRVSIVIPCNGYTLCYSPKYEDLFKSIPSTVYDYLEYTHYEVHDGTPEQANAEKRIRSIITRLFKEGNYVAGPQHTNDAAMSTNEVMIYPTDYSELQYYAFSEQFWSATVVPMIRERFYASK